MHPPEHNPEQQMQRRLPKPPTSPMNAAIPSSSVLLVLPIYQTLSLSLSLSLSLNNPKSYSTRETQNANLLELKKSRYTKHPQNKKNKKKTKQLFASLKSSSKSRWNQNHVPRGAILSKQPRAELQKTPNKWLPFANCNHAHLFTTQLAAHCQ
jgi:hypothetical protein